MNRTKKLLRVLFVEDGEHNKPLVCRELIYAGYQLADRSVRTLSDLERVLAEGDWDVILSDYHLSGFSCIDVINSVQARRLDLPVIVISRYEGEEAAVDVMKAGAHDFIRKEHVERVVPAIERELAEMEIHRERKRVQQQLTVSEERFHQLTETIDEVFWLFELESARVTYVSPTFERVWERSSNWLLAATDPLWLLETVHPEDYLRLHEALEHKGWSSFNATYRIVLPSGGERWIHSRTFPITNEQGSLVRIAVVSRDVTERQKMQMEMQTMIRALEQTADVVMITDRHGLIEYVNPAFERTTGFSRHEALGRQPNILKSGFQDAQFYVRVWNVLKSGLPFSDVFINRRKDGELYYESKTITPVRDSLGEITHYVATGKDITTHIRAEERLHQMVNYDAVTGLANRILLIDRLDQALLDSHRHGGCIGILHIEFALSSMLGGEVEPGVEERLLRAMALRLRELVGGHATLARLHQQAFVVMESFTGSSEEMARLVNRIVKGFERPVVADGYQVYVTPTIGISISPEGGETPEQMLSNAAMAMRQVHQGDPHPYQYYSKSMTMKKGRLSS